MIKKNFSLSIYYIIPIIFGLFSLLSFIISFQIVYYCMLYNKTLLMPLMIYIGLLMFIISTILGYYIIRFILKPSEEFIEKIKQTSVIENNIEEENNTDKVSDQIKEFSKIFDQVAQTIDVMDAEKLFPKIIGKSNMIRQVFSQIIKVAPTESTVLIQGESGTGKELIAQSIVEQSERNKMPFIRINCAAISPSLMESELFGHERGSFTGAIAQKKGCFELANGGTLFLDEIGDMPLEHQVKLLRVLQENKFFRVGGNAPIKVDVRIIAATNKELEISVKDKQFREDLFYRINVFPIFIPPLRARPEDIELLANHFLKLAAFGKIFNPNAMEVLKTYNWPGNVRELENVIERAAVLAEDSSVVLINHLPTTMLNSLETLTNSFSEIAVTATEEHKNLSLDEALKDIEKSLICEALKATNGVQIKAAKKLGVSQRSFWNKVKKFEINVDSYKND